MASVNMVVNDFGTAWYDLLDELFFVGRTAEPRGIKIRERVGVSFTVTNALNNILVDPARNLNYRFMVAEWLWILAGQHDLATITRYNKKMALFSDDGETLAGAYGPRLITQWPYLIYALTHDHDTRQAVATIYTPCPARSKDIPCTLSLQLLIRDSAMHGIVTMRSSDIWLGLPYDFFTFSQFVNSFAARFEVSVGSITFNLGSSHLYETNFEAAREALRNQTFDTLASPRMKAYLTTHRAYEILNHNKPADYGELAAYAAVLHEASTRAEGLEVLRGLA